MKSLTRFSMIAFLSGFRVAMASPQDLLNEAAFLEDQHCYLAASTTFERYLEQVGDDSAVRLRLGRLYLRRLQDLSLAERHLKVCANDEHECECSFLLAEAYADQMMRANVVDKVMLTIKAKAALNSAVACDPASLDYRKAMVQYYVAIPGAGGYERGHKEADDLAHYNAFGGQLLHALNYSYQGDDRRAVEAFEDALALDPTNVQGLLDFADHYRRRGKVQSAIALLQQAAERVPGNPEILHALGRMWMRSHQDEKAKVSLLRAWSLKPWSTDIVHDLAITYEKLDRRSEATELFRRCLSLDDPRGSEANDARRKLAILTAQRPGGAEKPAIEEEHPQQAKVKFFAPVTLAYLLACVGWLGLARWKFVSVPAEPFPQCSRSWVEFGVALVAVVGVLLLGMAYQSGYLLPRGKGWMRHVLWNVNNLIIYSPIFILMVVRGHSLQTIFLSANQWGRKVMTGLILALVSTAAYLAARGELSTFPEVLKRAFQAESLTNITAVFLEGVALAYLFVRFRWALGYVPAILIPAVLFALGHIGRQIESGESVTTMVIFFVFNSMLPAVILAVIAKSRDVIWIGVVHYIMDVAIKAFQ